MKLYHGTTLAHWKKIKTQGLIPRRSRKGNWEHTVQSHGEAVYLTNAYALYYACANKGNSPVILEIDTTKLKNELLVPDEDAIEQSTRNRDELPKHWSMIARTIYYRERLPLYKNTDSWKASLEAIGNCCYLSTIPLSAITKVAIIDKINDHLDLLMTAMDPSISLMNYRFIGRKYRGLTKWLFDYPLGDDAPVEYKGLPNDWKGPTSDWMIPPAATRKAIKLEKLR